MRWQIGDKELLLQEKKSAKSYYISGVLILSIILLLIVYLTPSLFSHLINKYYTSQGIYYTIAIALVILTIGFLLWGIVMSFVFIFTKPKNVTQELVRYIEFKIGGLKLIYYDNHIKFIPYSELINNTMRIGFTNALGLKIFKSMNDFFQQAYGFIKEVIDKHPNKKIYVVISGLKKGEDVPFFQIIISPYILDLKKFLDDWRENYERYLKSVNVGEECKIHRKEAQKKKEIKINAKTHFYALFAIIILSIISFIFLALIPYLNTSITSPDYATSVTFLISDGFLTSVLIVIGIIKLPRLWKTMKEKVK